MPRWNCTAESLGVGNRYCTCCERDLTGHAVRMLELDQRTNTYHDIGNVPADKSQGWFPFGLKCAQRQIAEHASKVQDDIQVARQGAARHFR